MYKKLSDAPLNEHLGTVSKLSFNFHFHCLSVQRLLRDWLILSAAYNEPRPREPVYVPKP